MPEEYNKLAEGIVKGSVPMVASFVERYLSDDEPGFFVGDREHVEGDIRVHVTVFGQLEQANSHLTDSIQMGVVDLQQLPDGRVWMVVGTLPTLAETEAWLSDLYSAMVRRMAARLVQFGFLDAPNRPRLRAASTMALTQVAQALKPPKPAPAPQPPSTPAASAAPIAQAAEPPQAVASSAPVRPSVATATPPEPPARPLRQRHRLRQFIGLCHRRPRWLPRRPPLRLTCSARRLSRNSISCSRLRWCSSGWRRAGCCFTS